MPETKRAWTEEDRAKLRSMAGKIPSGQIAAKLGRTNAALAVEACRLGLSLRTKGRGQTAEGNAESPSLAQST